MGARMIGDQEARLVGMGGLALAPSGVHVPEEAIELSAAPRTIMAHAELEAAQTKLEVLQALAQVKMALVEAKLATVKAHVPESQQVDHQGWFGRWGPQQSDLMA